jgi:hypothetical protein
MTPIFHESINSVDKNISVNSIIIENHYKPITDHELDKLSKYYNDLKKAGLIDLINFSSYYDKDKYDFYFNLGDASGNWYRKLILKSSIVDLVINHNIINFVVEMYYEQ